MHGGYLPDRNRITSLVQATQAGDDLAFNRIEKVINGSIIEFCFEVSHQFLSSPYVWQFPALNFVVHPDSNKARPAR